MDPRFEYVESLHGLECGQIRQARLGTRYAIELIEKSGFVICRRGRKGPFVRLWCDVLLSWPLAP
jgi:hypothetical protein